MLRSFKTSSKSLFLFGFLSILYIKITGISIGITNPKCFSGFRLQSTTPTMRIPANKPIDAA